jgi:hypothetical protein
MDGVHSAGMAADLAAAEEEQDGPFMSLRFGAEHSVLPHAMELRDCLGARGAKSTIVNMAAGGDIDTQVFQSIEKCSAFIVFGSAKYGEDTGNSACTYYEYKYAKDRNKRIILIRMIPFGEDFDELQARVIFGANKLELPWMLGAPMPVDLPDKIMEVLLGVAAQPPAAAPAPAPSPAALGQVPAAASPLPSIKTLQDFAAAVADIDDVDDLLECTPKEMAELLEENSALLKGGAMGKKQRRKLLEEHASGGQSAAAAAEAVGSKATRAAEDTAALAKMAATANAQADEARAQAAAAILEAAQLQAMQLQQQQLVQEQNAQLREMQQKQQAGAAAAAAVAAAEKEAQAQKARLAKQLQAMKQQLQLQQQQAATAATAMEPEPEPELEPEPRLAGGPVAVVGQGKEHRKSTQARLLELRAQLDADTASLDRKLAGRLTDRAFTIIERDMLAARRDVAARDRRAGGTGVCCV